MAGPLEGYRIVDISSVVSGPLATMMLADQGADVVKIESTDIGDTTRAALNYRAGMAALFANCNRGKRSIALDLKDPRGREIVLELVRGADVFVENWRPGTADRLGLGEEDLRRENPDLIYASISGYGPEGPYRNQRVYDQIIQAQVGMIGAQRNPENGTIDLVRNIISDKATSYTVAQAITAALLARERARRHEQGNHGKARGQHINISMLDSTLAFFWPDGMMQHTMTGDGIQQPFSVTESNRLWKTSDGHVVTLFQSRDEIRGLAAALEHPEWAKDDIFLDNAKRFHPDNLPRVTETIQAAMMAHTTEEIVRRFTAEDVPVAPVIEREDVYDHLQRMEASSVIDRDSPAFGAYRQARPGAAFSDTQPDTARHAPLLGEHCDEILEELGYTPKRVAELRADSIIL
jgi:crotonobetainyl-CoA:carnitine CoA-transferase CaiB-like acyl-CoA transferase